MMRVGPSILVHLRCEITDNITPALIAENMSRDIVRVISITVERAHFRVKTSKS